MAEASEAPEKPLPGDRVKLIGSHKYAGYEGLYLSDSLYIGGVIRPKVKLVGLGIVTFVSEPERQMRKA